jgi:hypothetical protein
MFGIIYAKGMMFCMVTSVAGYELLYIFLTVLCRLALLHGFCRQGAVTKTFYYYHYCRNKL